MTSAEKKAAVDELSRFLLTTLTMGYGAAPHISETSAGSRMVVLPLPGLTINIVITPARGS